jgi:hypothetical protein
MASARVVLRVCHRLTEYVVHSGEECSFEPTHQKSVRGELGKGGHPVLQKCEHAPEDLHEWNQVVHGYPGEKEEEWELSKHSS